MTILALLIFCFCSAVYAQETAPASLIVKVEGRQAFVRNETGAKLQIRLESLIQEKLTNVTLTGTWVGKPVSLQVPELLPGARCLLPLSLETRLKTGKYLLAFRYEAMGEGGKVTGTAELEIFIAPLLHDLMPIIMWDSSPYRIGRQAGFTHSQEYITWRFGQNRAYPFPTKHFDQALMDGFRFIEPVCIPKAMADKYPRYDRNGKVRRAPQENIEVSNPAFVQEWAEFIDKAFEVTRNHPVFEVFNVLSERRDGTSPSFGKCEPEAFRKFAGYPIPEEVENLDCLHYTLIRNFPLSRVIPETFPLYVYYKWFWKQGDGWNDIYNLTHKIAKTGSSHRQWTFFDPAVRALPVWGSGGNCDYISQWIYAYPDPIRVGAATSELQAMAAGTPGQGVMNMTQIIAYRNAVAPIGAKSDITPEWVKGYPKAPFITLAPDLMKEAAWTQISRHVSGIMFHGSASLFPNPNPNASRDQGYQCTNDETKEVLSAFFAKVVKPLGPVLKRIPERERKIAILESFSSSVFAHRGTWGDRNWLFDAQLMMLWANLAPSVIYDEEIVRSGLGSVKVLVMPYCDVLTEPVFRKVKAFQDQGGLIVADRYLVPGIMPDITIEEYVRTGDSKKDKMSLQSAGMELRRKLAPYCQPYAEASNPDLVTWVRSSEDADYLFVVNDKRTFGDYWGPFGLVMETNLPNQGTVTLQRNAGAVYDPVAHKEVIFRPAEGKTEISVDFSAHDNGRLFLVLPEKIGTLQMSLPKRASCGETVEISITPEFVSGKRILSLHPLRIEVSDSDGLLTDDSVSGTASIDGICRHRISVPLNGSPGIWKVLAEDLATGKTVGKSFEVR